MKASVRLTASVAFVFWLWWSAAAPAAATSLQIAPLLIKTSLAKGEYKKGYVDVSNPLATAATVYLQVNSFVQADDDGRLNYLSDEQIQAGVKLDLTEVVLPPRGTLRVYYQLDSSKLKTGDNCIVIFASSSPVTKDIQTLPGVRVGALLYVENATLSKREAVVEDLSAPLWQIGEGIEARFKVRNTAESGQATGFFPPLTMQYGGYAEQKREGPLVFAGRSREVTYRQAGDFIGVRWLRVATGSSQQQVPVIAVTGYWRWLAPLLGIGVGMAIVVIVAYLRRKRRKSLALSSHKRYSLE